MNIYKSILVAIALLAPTAAQADQRNYNQNHGFSLPSAPLPNGFDEVRAADGTTCRSSMSGNGAYLDLGGIAGNSQNGGSFNSGAVYGRLVVPLGKKPGRIDCRSLYQLEIDRLKYELRLAKGGIGNGQNASAGGGAWQKEGWNNQ